MGTGRMSFFNFEEWNQDRMLYLITSILSILSFIGVFYIFISILLMRIVQRNNSNIILHTHIFYASICGIFNFASLVVNFAPNAMIGNDFKYPPIPCQIIGIIAQMAPICEAMWFCLIAITLNQILHRKWSILDLNMNLKFHHVGIWSFGFIMTAIPFFNNAYGGNQISAQ